jgi:hypothetical protein
MIKRVGHKTNPDRCFAFVGLVSNKPQYNRYYDNRRLGACVNIIFNKVEG